MTAVESAHRQGLQALFSAAGVDVTYYPAGGLEADEATIRGDFIERYERMDPVTMQLIGTSPAFHASEDDISDAKQGDRLLIDGDYFHVIEPQTDSAGGVLLILSRETQIPIAPSRLNAELSMGQIVLAWTRNASNNTAVEVWTSNDGSTWVRLDALAAGVTTYTDESGSVAQMYKVRNTNKSGPSPFTHIFNTLLWALTDENGNLISDESGNIIIAPA